MTVLRRVAGIVGLAVALVLFVLGLASLFDSRLFPHWGWVFLIIESLIFFVLISYAISVMQRRKESVKR